jgi:hypothetical protein
LKQIDDD